MNRVNPNPNETLTLTLIPNRQRTQKNTARSKDREGERGKGMGGGSPELNRRPPVANPNRVKHREEKGCRFWKGSQSRTLTRKSVSGKNNSEP